MSPNNMFSMLQQFASNPVQAMMATRFKIPQEYQGSPDQMVQYLVNSGQISQDQMNMVQMKKNELQGNPLFRNLLK